MKPIIALDVGDVRIGVAISDSSQILASPYGIFQRPKNKALNQIISLIKENNSELLLVGLPFDEDGNKNEQCEKIIAFATRLSKRVTIEIEYFDESFTTLRAREHLINIKSKEEVKSKLDALAAAFMLQEYLDIRNKK